MSDAMGSTNHRLDRARGAGFLNAAGRNREALKAQYALWCWRLRLPAVWCERKSPRSKFGRVALDLFTTPYLLTERGLSELQRLAETLRIGGRTVVSTGDGVWDDVPVQRLEELARAVFRTVTRYGSYELRKATAPPQIVRMFETISQRVSMQKSA